MSDSELDVFSALMSNLNDSMRWIGIREGILACAKYLRQHGHTSAADDLTEHAHEIGGQS